MSVLVLALFVAAPADRWLELPPVMHGAITARLALQVAGQGPAPGRARVRFRLRVQGPRGLQVDGPQLEDALAAWRTTWQASSWAEDEPTVWEMTWQLDQGKAGAVPLPGVHVRVRTSDAAAWQEASWPEPLREPRDVAPAIPVPPAPQSPWPRRLRMAAVAVACALAAILLARRLHRWLRARRHPPSAAERTLAAIDAIMQAYARPSGSGPPDIRHVTALTDLAAITRDYLAQAISLPVGRRTTRELLTALAASAIDSSAIDAATALLTTADLVKFAGTAVDAATVTTAAEQARRTITEMAKTGQSQPVGELRADGKNGDSGEGG